MSNQQGGHDRKPPHDGYSTSPPEGIKPWERWPGESARAYDAFLAYREFGAERSTAKVARKLGKSKAIADRWSRQWRWVFRTDQWDADVHKRADEILRGRLGEIAEQNATMLRAAYGATALALQRLVAKMQAEDADPPAFGTVMAAVDTVVHLRQEQEQISRQLMERGGMAGPMDVRDAREELERRLRLMVERRRTSETVESTSG